MTPEQFKALRTAEDNLTAMLCDPEGKCCISGSDADRRIIDDALDILRALAAEPAPEPVAKMNMPLIWLYSHCRALGMTKHSDSGQLEHDIALFVADLKDAHPPKAEPAPTTQVPVAWHKMAGVWIGGDVFEDRWVACSEDSAGAEPLYAQSTQSAKEK